MNLFYMPILIGLLIFFPIEICSGLGGPVSEQLKKMEQQNKDSRLLEAVVKSCTDKVERLLTQGANPNALSSFKVTPFSHALAKNNPEIIRVLKEHGGTLVAVFPKGYDFTRLYNTCKLLSFNERIISELYQPFFKGKEGVAECSWMHTLAFDKRYRYHRYGPLWKNLVTEFLQSLTEEACNTRDAFGNPPLYYARVSNNTRLQQMVNKNNFDKTAENLLGDTAEQFIRNARPFVYYKPNTDIEVLEINPKLLGDVTQITQMFPDHFNFFDVEKVLRAVSYDADKAFTILNCIFTNLDQQDGQENTLLHHIVFISSHNYVCDQLSELLKKLIKNGADPDKKNRYGCTPLHIASFKNKECLVRALLSDGADPLEKLTDGRRARDLTHAPKVRTALAHAILERRKKYITDVLEDRVGQSITRVLGDLIAKFEAPEVDEKTGNIKISYHN